MSCARRTAARAVIAATLSAALFGAAPAHATDYPANPTSLGMIENGTGGSTTCAFGPPRDVTFDVAGLYGPITDVGVTLSFDPPHNHVGDLSVTLIAPGATASAPVFHRTGLAEEGGGHEAGVVGPYTFSDSAPETPSWFEAANVGGQATIPAGAYRASTTAPGGDGNLSLTAPFAASNPNGLWTLRVLDSCGSDTGGVGGATLSLDTEPPNAITFGKAKRNKSKGTATLEVGVQAPGTVEIAGKKVKAASVQATAPGTVVLAVKAKGNAKRRLKAKGKAKVSAAVTFTPVGGVAATQTKKLKLVKK